MIVLICLLPLKATAPGHGLNLFREEKTEPLTEAEAESLRLEPLIKAVTWVEVADGRDLYNEAENAVGWFQIRQIRVDHYNYLTGSDYKLEDFYDYELSREMFIYFARGKTFEQAAKDWNGSGVMTESYWQKVKSAL